MVNQKRLHFCVLVSRWSSKIIPSGDFYGRKKKEKKRKEREVTKLPQKMEYGQQVMNLNRKSNKIEGRDPLTHGMKFKG